MREQGELELSRSVSEDIGAENPVETGGFRK